MYFIYFRTVGHYLHVVKAKNRQEAVAMVAHLNASGGVIVFHGLPSYDEAIAYIERLTRDGQEKLVHDAQPHQIQHD